MATTKQKRKSRFWNKKIIPLYLFLVFILMIFILNLKNCYSLSNSISYSYIRVSELKSTPYGRYAIHYILYNFENNKEIKGYSSSTSADRKVNVGDVFICSYDSENPKTQFVYWDKKIDNDIDIKNRVPTNLMNEHLSFIQILKCAIE